MARSARPWFSAEKGWWMVYLGGKKVRLAKGKLAKKDADRRFRELLTVRDNNPAPDSPVQTVASVIDTYLRLHVAAYSPRAYEERRRYLQLFAEAHGWRPVTDRDCKPIHLELWLHEHPEWKSDWTKSQVINIVLRPFNWAARKRLIPSNPFRGVEKTQGNPRRPITDDEYQALLRATNTWPQRPRSKRPYPCDRRRRRRPSSGARFRQVLVFLRFTGARPGELCGLRWEDIDIARQLICLCRHKTIKSTRRPRIIPLHPVVLKLLIHVRRRNDPGPHVFLNHRKTPWNRSNLALRVRRARKLAGIPEDAKLYGLRHRFGTEAVINGLDIKTLAELMGHTTTRMTEHYLHLSGRQAHLAAAMLRANARRPAT
jgi:integrase